ncbi:MAG TPA: gluconate 2-dehydrogenase subunit 3 family protein [Gemmatimonadaceae bacterium]|nr:gluconate 2-dehydrogenase subunit 3 family protein [Gemmatimonadaceae bacterium]
MPNGKDVIDRTEETSTIDRREAIRRVGFFLGGVTFIGGTSLLTACQNRDQRVSQATQAGEQVGQFSTADMDFLDEVADTILPETKTPGAKAAKVGPFIAVMVTDCYDAKEQKIFRDGMTQLNDACRKANNVGFAQATPQQRLSLLETLDKEQKTYTDAVEAARRKKSDTTTTAAAKKAEAHLPDERKEAGIGGDAGAATAITADSPPHYFRMMKELTLLGYFTSEIGCKQAQRYAETPGKYDPCVPYKPGDKAWAPHA